MSAVRNLNGTDVGGRPLRIDLADSDPFLEGKTTVRGELIDSGGPENKWSREKDWHEDRRQGSSSSGPAFLSNLPPGVQIPPGSTALDAISQSLATMEPSQLLEVLAQMKVCTKRTFPRLAWISRIVTENRPRLCVLFLSPGDRHLLLPILSQRKRYLWRILSWPTPSFRRYC
jgi:hypothetical protein